MHNITVYYKDGSAAEWIEGVVGQAGSGALVQFEQYDGNQILLPISDLARIEAVPISDDEEILNDKQTTAFIDWYVPALDKAKARYEEEASQPKTNPDRAH